MYIDIIIMFHFIMFHCGLESYQYMYIYYIVYICILY